MTISNHRHRSGAYVLVSIVIDDDLWSIPVQGRVRFDGSLRIISGRLWRGITVKAKTVRFLR